jgi:dienelactone hydrolase
MADVLSRSQRAGVAQRAAAPASTARPEHVGLGRRARALMRDRVRLFQVGAAVIAVAVADDAFVHPEPGTSAGDHLASGLIPIAIAVLAALAYPRLRAGLRGCIALVFGALALEAGIVDGIRHVLINTASGDDLTAILAALAGAGLLVLGAVTLWDSRRADDPRSRRYARRALESVLDVARDPVPVANLGAAYRTVTFTTSDGLRLSGWYVPSRNGAVVIVSPGRSAQVQEHARMLLRHGYGVLVFDRRGEGQSQGDRNRYGWSGDKDLIATVAFLGRQPDLRHGEIGGLGLSVGGEMLLQTAAETTALKAVVSEGAGRRSLREHLHIPGLGAVQKWVTPWVVQTGALTVMSNAAPPPDLAHVVTHISARHLLLIRALHGLDDESLNRVYYAHAGRSAALWEVPRGGHTGALAAMPQQYEARVVGFFDRALLAGR